MKNERTDIQIFDVSDIQRIFRVSRKTAYSIVHMPGFPAFTIDSMIRVERTALDAWLARQKGKHLFT